MRLPGFHRSTMKLILMGKALTVMIMVSTRWFLQFECICIYSFIHKKCTFKCRWLQLHCLCACRVWDLL